MEGHTFIYIKRQPRPIMFVETYFFYKILLKWKKYFNGILNSLIVLSSNTQNRNVQQIKVISQYMLVLS